MNNSRINVSPFSRQSLVYITSSEQKAKAEAKEQASQTWGVMGVVLI